MVAGPRWAPVLVAGDEKSARGGKRSNGPALMAVCRGIGVMMMKIFVLAARGGAPSAHCDGRNGELGPIGGDGRAHDVSLPRDNQRESPASIRMRIAGVSARRSEGEARAYLRRHLCVRQKNGLSAGRGAG